MAPPEGQGFDRSTSAETEGSSSSEISMKSIKDGICSEVSREPWYSEGLIVVVIGASGDLAKKKTYPSLLALYDDNLLPPGTIIWGYARSGLSHEDLRARLKPFLLKTGHHSERVVDGFLSLCFYQRGASYGDLDSYSKLADEMASYEERQMLLTNRNRLYYLAIPPNVFGDAALAIKRVGMTEEGRGWTRIVIEKPFGHDLGSCNELLNVLSSQFEETEMFRIDHYLGKEMVQNLLILRFGNSLFEWIWNRNAIASVVISFKEPFGTEGRGGYFDNIGIIRDVIQNHLLQVLTLLAMEPPSEVDGVDAGDLIRDAKVQVLKAIPPIELDDCVLGQYEGYTDDQTIENKDTHTATYAAVRCFVNSPRWAGVPFILKAGKALDERRCEIRVQFRDAPASRFMFRNSNIARNELVMCLQPQELMGVSVKTNVKSPGFTSVPITSDMEMRYDDQFYINKDTNPDAYTRLLLDVLRGRNAAFVRDDELRRSWEIFTPLLHHIDDGKVPPFKYAPGSLGPTEAEDFIETSCNFLPSVDTTSDDIGKLLRKSSL